MSEAPRIDHIGVRIRYWRRRRNGMSQVVLAGLAGVTQSYISHVEAGRKGIERRSTLVAIAAALQVSMADLLDQPGEATDPAYQRASAVVPQLRVRLAQIAEEDIEPARRGVEEMDATLAELARLRADARYGDMAVALPGILRDAASYGGRYLARVGYDVGDVLKNLGYRDLALSAARIAVDGALAAEDPAWIGATRYFYSLALPMEAPKLSGKVATKALAELQTDAAEPRARQMLGQLHLAAALASAVDRRADDAAAHLTEATREGRSLGDPEDGTGFNLMCFGPTNIGLWRMAVAGELAEQGRVIEIARQVNPSRLQIADRHYAYWTSLGRALAVGGKADREALVAFINAERAVPVAFSRNQAVRDSVVSMVLRARRRSVSRDLRVLARRLGIEVPTT
ncbi:MAG: transcriptional regulator [Actinobacteria bacterium 13_2_20CM_2_72_6]|nr:MAG: transcriptional regulator [Actinobacteria bacterium 13_2_20CM_2_72_6]